MANTPVLSPFMKSLQGGSILDKSGIGKIISSLGGPMGLATGGLALAPTIAKLITGFSQKHKANQINPVDPGFQANTEIQDNARKVNDYYNNYTLPGQGAMLNTINSNTATGIDAVNQGASSSGDIIDGITKLSSGQNDALSALGIKSAQSKESLLPMVLQANAASGNEIVRKNEFDNQRYQEKLAEKAALNSAAAQNTFSAGDSISALGGSILNYNTQPWSSNKLDANIIKAINAKFKTTA